MNWLKKLINKILKKNKTKLLETSQIFENEKQDNGFGMDLKRLANPEIDDGNGYKINRKLKLKEMI